MLPIRESPKLSTIGFRYHMRNIGGGWIPDHGLTGGDFMSSSTSQPFQIRLAAQSIRLCDLTMAMSTLYLGYPVMYGL